METRSPLLVVISAPSGGGKTTVCRSLLEADAQLSRVVTCTTRDPRPGEVEGVDYHFLDEAEFAGKVAAGEFLEHATVYGRRYGTLKSGVLARLAAGSDVLLNIDVQGAASVRAVARMEPVLQTALVTVFLLPPSREELERRLRGRGTEPEEIVRRRLGQAEVEMVSWGAFDYVVTSGSMAEDLGRVQSIIQAERLRSNRRRPERSER